MFLTLSALQTKRDTCANSVDPDETASDDLSHQDLQCLPFWFIDFRLKRLFSSMYLTKLRDVSVHCRYSSVEGLTFLWSLGRAGFSDRGLSRLLQMNIYIPNTFIM